ncbi:helix-turn-helix domain-containing protein [Microbacterium sp. NPDC078428]|uniref:helix-turn-helix domain-containing protein n=1 Tax=Microbacterium sp. NPDC078428 TaxID=3364190 RepID=UPI0037C543F2
MPDPVVFRVQGQTTVPSLTIECADFNKCSAMRIEGGPGEVLLLPQPDAPVFFIMGFLEFGDLDLMHQGAWVPLTGMVTTGLSTTPTRVRSRTDWSVVTGRVPWNSNAQPQSIEESEWTVAKRSLADEIYASGTAIMIDGARKGITKAEATWVEQMMIEGAGLSGLRNLRSGGGTVWVRAMRVIRQNCTDPRFGTTDVAAALRISERRLQEVFREQGRTVVGEIRRIRVQAALRALRNPTMMGLPFEQVAASAGFASAASMRQAMRDHLGTSPTRIRDSITMGPGTNDQPVKYAS